jgi:AcrR family transcriptional regulator
MKTEARRAARRLSLAEQLVAPIEALLAEGHSFTELTVEQIISRAGVARSTFYYTFGDKGELLIAVSQTAIKEIVEASYTLYALEPDSSREDFTAAVRRTVRTWRPHVSLMNALAELATYDARVNEQFLIGWAAARRGIADHIAQGQAAGRVRPELHVEHTAAWLTWMAERGMSQMVASAPAREVEAMVLSLASIVWNTLYER